MKKEIFVLSFVRMLTAAGYVISIPFLNIFLYNEKGVPMKIIGFYITLASLIGAFSRIYSGKLIHKFSSILIMNIGLISRLFAFLIFFLLVLFNSPVYLFFFAFVLNSIGFSFYGTASDTYVGEKIMEKERPKAYGIIRIGANIGWGLGPVFGGFLSNISYPLLFLIGTLLSLISFLINFSFIKDRELKIPSNKDNYFFGEILNDKNFLKFLIGSFLIYLVVGQLISSLPVFARYKGLNNLKVGYLFSVNGLMVVFLQYFISYFITKIKNKFGIVLGSFLYFIGYLSFSWANSLNSFIIGVIIFTLGEMMTLPLITTITTIIAPPEKKGIYIGILGFAEGIGWATAPLIGGFLIDMFIKKPLLLWIATSSFAFFSILFYLRVTGMDGKD